MRARPFVALCLALAAGAAMADLPGDPRPACAPYSAASDPFEPTGDPALRLAELARREGDVAALTGTELYGLGALYRLGREHPAGLVGQDLAKARRYLELASWSGQIEALASLAELELAAGHPGEAMMWAQVYVKAMRVRDKGRGLGYPAHLLKRILLQLPPSSKVEQERLLGEFMRAQGEKFRAHQAQAKDAQDAADCRRVDEDWPTRLVTDRAALVRPKGRPARRLEAATSGFAFFHLLVDPSGGIASVRVIESVPTARMAQDLDALLREMHFNPVDASAPGRQVLVPLSLDRGEVRLRD